MTYRNLTILQSYLYSRLAKIESANPNWREGGESLLKVLRLQDRLGKVEVGLLKKYQQIYLTFKRQHRMNKIDQYLLSIRPIINVKGLEAAAKLPGNSLQRHFIWLDGKPSGTQMARGYYWNVMVTLVKTFGQIEFDDRTWSYDQEIRTLFYRKWVRDTDTVEVDNHFEYYVMEYRGMDDEMDFFIDYAKQE